MLDEKLPGWGEKYHRLLGWGGRPLTKEERKKANEFLEKLKNAPSEDDIQEPL
jgi:hypothetical protein